MVHNGSAYYQYSNRGSLQTLHCNNYITLIVGSYKKGLLLKIQYEVTAGLKVFIFTGSQNFNITLAFRFSE